MASTQTTPKLTNSFFVDANHLSWQDLRKKVLGPRQIHLHDPSPAISMPSELLLKIQTNLDNLERFDEQRSDFRTQVETGRSFGDSPIWPPNSLPWISGNTNLQRVTSPRLSRETLPRQSPKEPGQLLELPTPRPALACGFASETFTEIELSNLPGPLTTSGSVVDFDQGLVATGVPIHCPFFVFERVKGLAEDSIETARNQCALSGSACVRGLQLLYTRAFGGNGSQQQPVAFSCTIDNTFAIINYHWLTETEQYNMTSLCKFDLTKDDHFNKFQAWVEAIEDWALTRLLPKIKTAVKKLSSSTDTPPLSPMPSLTLSVDTSAGGDDGLMRALRSTFSTIRWRYQGLGETPIMSSIAQCGTPLPARFIRSLALSPITPSSPMDRKGVQSIKVKIPQTASRTSLTPISPSSRTFEMSPLRLSSLPPDSPVRPGSLSPCTPPEDAPFGPFRPILVVQRRLDHAMDEIRDLKKELARVQQELNAKKTESSPTPAFATLDVIERLAKRIELIEFDKLIASPTAALQSRSSSMKDSFVKAIRAIESNYLTAGASLLAVTSILLVGRLLGYRLVESLSCVLPSTNILHPRRLVGSWRAAIFRALSV